MKKFLQISLPIFLVAMLCIELGFRFAENQVDLMVLTGKKEGVNPMLATWAKNEPFFSYSAAKSFPLEGKTINNYGFISTPNISVKKDSLVKRIAFLGGSSTAGTGQLLKDEETWPWKVAESINDAGYAIDFINAAASGYTTFESYGVLWSKLRFFKPDVIIINHGWNDFSYFKKDKKELLNFRKNAEGVFEGVKFLIKYETYEPLILDKYIHFSQVLSRLRLSIWHNEGRGEVYIKDDPELSAELSLKSQGSVAFQENLELIKAYCKMHGIACFFCLQPTLVLNPSQTPSMEAEFMRVESIKGHMDNFGLIFSAVKEIASNKYLIDLRSVSYKEENFRDYIHPSPAGTDRIASIVVDSLLNNYFDFEVE